MERHSLVILISLLGLLLLLLEAGFSVPITVSEVQDLWRDLARWASHGFPQLPALLRTSCAIDSFRKEEQPALPDHELWQVYEAIIIAYN